jgi:DMSO/TMAO reductase YedYZ molybdopterin-dependent catalytic subunit
MARLVTRRAMLGGLALAAPAVLIGCDRLAAAPSFQSIVFDGGAWLNYRVQRLIGGDALAREFRPDQMSPDFRTNGNTTADTPEYRQHLADGFINWRLMVGGLVEQPKSYSLADLQAMPQRSQITRHDCVEGWSAIGKWTGVPLAAILNEVKLKPETRYLVFRCADDFGGIPYYESIDLIDAFHPQTILAHGMNDGVLSEGHGAPIRLRVERQLGYKQAKYVMGIDAVATLADIGKGKGGYWEDEGAYAWYAGI